ncbi:MAG: M50 family metallopeptidase [Candidatus Nanopelagicaceae bacterium]|nr:RIP metalloprotease [Actinomycetota bacterium]
MGVLGVLAFVVGLLFSVMVHEWGHYITAVKYRMKVTEFFLGFGQRIWSFQRGETEFGLKAIPAGGYCKIVGMSPQEELEPADQERAFYKAPVIKKLVVLGSGAFLHFVLGILFIALLIGGVGLNQSLPKVESVIPCITTAENCSASDPISPAQRAGIKVGDEIVGVNGEKARWNDIVKVIRASANKEITLIVSTNGQERTVAITPHNITIEGKSWGIIGVQNATGMVRENFPTSVKQTFQVTGYFFKSSIQALVSLPTKIPSLVRQTFFGEQRDSNGLVGIVGVARASAQTANSGDLSLREKLATFLLIIASLNIFVGIFNLLPILPLDGGHMAVAIVEAIRRRFARAQGKPDPGPIDVEKLTPITLVVFVALSILTLLLLAADIFNPIDLNL